MTKQTEELVYGIHAVKSLLKYDSTAIKNVWIDHARGDATFAELVKMLSKKGIAVERVDRGKLDAMTDFAVHQGVVARGCPLDKGRDESSFEQWLDHQTTGLFLLLLDGVQDPHNLGACLRSAAAAGCDAVIIPKDRASGLTAVVHKVSCGATQMLPLFQVTNLARVMESLRNAGVWIVGAEGEEVKTIYEVDMRGSLAIVMGAEGKGLRRLTRDKCDYLASIPINSQMESLNVSVATGVFLFEAVRQRRTK